MDKQPTAGEVRIPLEVLRASRPNARLASTNSSRKHLSEIEFHVTRSAEFPSFEDIERLCLDQGVQKIRIAGIVDFERMEPQLLLENLRLIRDITGCGVHADWESVNTGGYDLSGLFHLCPPRCSVEKAIIEWRERYKYGLFYWRRGPGFFFLQDLRSGNLQTFCLDDIETRHGFEFVRQGIVKSCDAPSEVSVLIDENIVFQKSGLQLCLPYRMRHWPVPFRAI